MVRIVFVRIVVLSCLIEHGVRFQKRCTKLLAESGLEVLMKKFKCNDCSNGPCVAFSNHPDASADNFCEICIGVYDGFSEWKEVEQPAESASNIAQQPQECNAVKS